MLGVVGFSPENRAAFLLQRAYRRAVKRKWAEHLAKQKAEKAAKRCAALDRLRRGKLRREASASLQEADEAGRREAAVAREVDRAAIDLLSEMLAQAPVAAKKKGRRLGLKTKRAVHAAAPGPP